MPATNCSTKVPTTTIKIGNIVWLSCVFATYVRLSVPCMRRRITKIIQRLPWQWRNWRRNSCLWWRNSSWSKTVRHFILILFVIIFIMSMICIPVEGSFTYTCAAIPVQENPGKWNCNVSLIVIISTERILFLIGQPCTTSNIDRIHQAAAEFQASFSNGKLYTLSVYGNDILYFMSCHVDCLYILSSY